MKAYDLKLTISSSISQEMRPQKGHNADRTFRNNKNVQAFFYRIDGQFSLLEDDIDIKLSSEKPKVLVMLVENRLEQKLSHGGSLNRCKFKTHEEGHFFWRKRKM